MPRLPKKYPGSDKPIPKRLQRKFNEELKKLKRMK